MTTISKTQNRIHALFQSGKKDILSIFYTAGYPALDDTISIAEYLEQAGVDMIEIGIPFSDPIADGPVIQASNKKAIENGMTVDLLLKQLKVIRSKVSIPIVLMGYMNPVIQYGMNRFIQDAARAGADGLILPDMPLEDYVDLYHATMRDENLSAIFLITPATSEERIKKVDGLSDGFVYAVSASSTTGVRDTFSPEQVTYFSRLKAMKLKNPVLIGFGVSNHTTFTQVCEHSAGAIIGSRFIEVLSHASDHQSKILTFVREIKN